MSKNTLTDLKRMIKFASSDKLLKMLTDEEIKFFNEHNNENKFSIVIPLVFKRPFTWVFGYLDVIGDINDTYYQSIALDFDKFIEYCDRMKAKGKIKYIQNKEKDIMLMVDDSYSKEM